MNAAGTETGARRRLALSTGVQFDVWTAELDALLPDCAIVRISNSGHLAPWDVPRAITAAMREWLR